MAADAEIAALLEQIAAEVRQRPPQRNWIAQFRDGEVLSASEAAEVCGVTPETIRRWCEAADGPDRPLGYLIGSMWLVDLPALLRLVEKRGGEQGRYDRVVAEGRAKNISRMLSSPHLSLPNLAKATG
jgi:hypothetical protein